MWQIACLKQHFLSFTFIYHKDLTRKLCIYLLFDWFSGENCGQVENSEIMETTEITENAVKQSNCIVYHHKIKKYTKPIWYIACEEKTTKIKIFCDFLVFVLSPIPENKNSEITGILQKDYNTEMWECSFKSSWNAVQMTSNSKSFSHIANLVAGIWGLKAFDPCGYINLIPFLLCQF